MFQSTRVDFIKLMLDANEMGLKTTSEKELEMKADDEEEKGEVTASTDKNGKEHSTRILKQMTMKVFENMVQHREKIKKQNKKKFSTLHDYHP